MLNDAADPAADRVALAFAQIFDLLGDVLAIEPLSETGMVRNTSAWCCVQA